MKKLLILLLIALPSLASSQIRVVRLTKQEVLLVKIQPESLVVDTVTINGKITNEQIVQAFLQPGKVMRNEHFIFLEPWFGIGPMWLKKTARRNIIYESFVYYRPKNQLKGRILYKKLIILSEITSVSWLIVITAMLLFTMIIKFLAFSVDSHSRLYSRRVVLLLLSAMIIFISTWKLGVVIVLASSILAGIIRLARKIKNKSRA